MSKPFVPTPKYAHDIAVQCCRCRNKHMGSDRVDSAPNKWGMRTALCPRCGATNFYRLDKQENEA